ncbi:MAG: metalloregulator ArsR/SmtB family transcription factor [Clostridia bacterium]
MQNFLIVNEKTKKKIASYMPTTNEISNLADFFQNFSDLSRLKIATLLSISELCVGDISIILKMNQTTVSHQLQILRTKKIVEFRRSGKIILYKIKNKHFNDLMLSAVNTLKIS